MCQINEEKTTPAGQSIPTTINKEDEILNLNRRQNHHPLLHNGAFMSIVSLQNVYLSSNNYIFMSQMVLVFCSVNYIFLVNVSVRVSKTKE